MTSDAELRPGSGQPTVLDYARPELDGYCLDGV